MESNQYGKENVSSTVSMYPPAYQSSPFQPSTTSYPQNPPPTGGQPYYPQPNVVYPGPQGINYPTQQTPSVVVVNNQQGIVTPVIFDRNPNVSMTAAIILSCIVFWSCGGLCGLIAFILAMVGQSSASAGDTRGAIQLRNASYGVSIAGVVCGVVLIIGLAAGMSAAVRRQCYSYYSYGYYYC